MCRICNQHICPSACPNADEPRPVYVCSGCSERILEGEDAWHILGEVFCEQCIDEARSEAEYIGDY